MWENKTISRSAEALSSVDKKGRRREERRKGLGVLMLRGSLRRLFSRRNVCARLRNDSSSAFSSFTKSSLQDSETDLTRRALVEKHTVITNVEGLALRLITDACDIYYCHDESMLPFPSPWWAFCWPGGQGLTRYILSNPSLFRGKQVLDIGSGCGSASIACKLAGASHVVANDVDLFAGTALGVNLELNRLSPDAVEFLAEDKMGAPASFYRGFDVVLVGDMLYDPDFSERLLKSLDQHPCVIFGDPGRTYCPSDFESHQLLDVYDYAKDGFQSIKVFRL